MKKLFFIFLILLSISVLAEDEIIIEPDNNIEVQKDLLQGEHEIIYEKPIELDEVSPYSKEGLKAIITRDYNLDLPDGLFKEQLTFKFNKKFFKEIELKGNYKTALVQTISDDSNFKFDPNSITIGVKGKFSDKEAFNTLFQVNPTGKSFFRRLVLDAWVETHRIKNNTVIFGTSRPTVGIEGGQSYYTLPFFLRSQTARNFGGVRKTGLRIKGDYKYFDYDIGGYSSDTYYTNFFPGMETDLWVGVKPLAKKENLGKLYVAGGYVGGRRHHQGYNVVSGAIQYDYKKFWMRGEIQNADGSNGASGLTNKKRMGYSATLAYRLTKKLEVLLRYDDFNPDKKVHKNNTREYSAGINYYILGQGMKLILDYIYCQNQASKNSHKILIGTQILL